MNTFYLVVWSVQGRVYCSEYDSYAEAYERFDRIRQSGGPVRFTEVVGSNGKHIG